MNDYDEQRFALLRVTRYALATPFSLAQHSLPAISNRPPSDFSPKIDNFGVPPKGKVSLSISGKYK